MAAKAWATDIAERIYRKECAAARRSGHKIPYTAQDGVFDDMSDSDVCWWTNGFWAGLLWQLYGAFGGEELKSVAEKIERKLDANLMSASGMDHDSGFKWLLTSGANYRLTKNASSLNRLLLAAGNLAGRFNPAGGFIRAWNDDNGEKAGLAIIDCMMNLPLLYAASDYMRDPRFRHVAEAHARTAAKEFIRDDGSAKHIVIFDPLGGDALYNLAGQGKDENSAWTRGQAWALYGFTLSYIHTKNEKYLSTAQKAAGFFMRNLPKNGLVPIDFMQPADFDGEDSSAAAIAACGLIELYNSTQKNEYLDCAKKLLFTLAKERCDFSPDTDNIVNNCSVAYRDAPHGIPLIYADYFFTEAILKLCGKETFLW